jgi:hypothetical protein
VPLVNILSAIVQFGNEEREVIFVNNPILVDSSHLRFATPDIVCIGFVKNVQAMARSRHGRSSDAQLESRQRGYKGRYGY